MSFTIENYFDEVKRVRITFLNNKFEVNWPVGTDINLNDRESKIHSALKRCYASNPIFKLTNSFIKTNIQISRIDKFDDEIDLYWETPKTIQVD